jgi:50S ribosomal protein L16 3-hydroxylase
MIQNPTSSSRKGLQALQAPDLPLALLGGLSPQTFMKRHWQKKPLLIRQAMPGFKPLLGEKALRELASQAEVESRFIAHSGNPGKPAWQVEQGPFHKAKLPPASRPNWTLLLQGVNLHLDSADELLQQFRFVPDARLDDLMISYATDGGGVGPHFDSYDVFLLQAHGTRRWRIGRQKDLALQDNVPLKLLSRFEPEQEFLLEPGDMLYLPPQYAHDGIAVGECMTYSIGFRAPSLGEMTRELLLRWADRLEEQRGSERRYADPKQQAVSEPAELPASFAGWVEQGMQHMLPTAADVQLLFGEYLTEPKASVWFDAPGADAPQHPWESGKGLKLDRRTRMQVGDGHAFVNGESWRASGRDMALMRRLAHHRCLSATELQQASSAAQGLLQQWLEDGWVNALQEEQR